MEKQQITPLFEAPDFSGTKASFPAGKLVLEKDESQQLRSLLEAENASNEFLARTCLRLDDAKEQVKQTQKKRDEFCLSIEKKYDISGKRWSVDFATGEIKIGN